MGGNIIESLWDFQRTRQKTMKTTRKTPHFWNSSRSQLRSPARLFILGVSGNPVTLYPYCPIGNSQTHTLSHKDHTFFLEYFFQFAPIATTKNLMSQLASTLLFVYLEIGKLGVARSVPRFFRLNREILYVAGKLTKLN